MDMEYEIKLYFAETNKFALKQQHYLKMSFQKDSEIICKLKFDSINSDWNIQFKCGDKTAVRVGSYLPLPTLPILCSRSED